MICENCGSNKQSRVIESRERQKFMYRKRKCLKCGYEYITHETFVKGQMPIDAPYVMPLSAIQKYEEAVWLEVKGLKLIATSVKRFTDTTVEFENGMIQIRKLYGKQWRVWNRKPSDRQRKEVEWNE